MENAPSYQAGKDIGKLEAEVQGIATDISVFKAIMYGDAHEDPGMKKTVTMMSRRMNELTKSVQDMAKVCTDLDKRLSLLERPIEKYPPAASQPPEKKVTKKE